MHLDHDAVHLGHGRRGTPDCEQRHQTEGRDLRPDRVLRVHAATFRRIREVAPILTGIATKSTAWSGRGKEPQGKKTPSIRMSATASSRLSSGVIIRKTTAIKRPTAAQEMPARMRRNTSTSPNRA